MRGPDLCLTVVAGIALGIAGPCAADDFYERRTINLYVGFNSGGGYDLYGRLLARHLGRHIPGQPRVVPQNMPGAAGLKVANYIYQVAPQDGTALGLAAEAIALEQALGGTGTEYDAAKLGWVGRIAPSASITFTWHTSKVRNIEDARKHESVIGATGVTGITSYTPRALNRLAGTRFKLVTGYTGSSNVLLALERNEVEGGFGIWPEFMSQKPDWISGKKINVLYIVAARRAPEIPDVPTTAELGTSPEANAVLAFLASTVEVGRAVFTTPGLPPERLSLLREAFSRTMADDEFKQDAERSGLRIDPLSGAELQRQISDVINSPRDIVEKAKAARE